MFILTPSLIRLAAAARSKETALAEVAQLLIDAALVSPSYSASMIAREAIIDTALGNAVALPHAEDLRLIRETAIAVLRIPGGVEWNEHERVSLVLAIAARPADHLAVLTQLSRVCGDPAALATLLTADEPQTIIAALTQRADQPSVQRSELPSLVVSDPGGLHLRPASQIVAITRCYTASIVVAYQGKQADARSPLARRPLGVPAGGAVSIAADGPDAEAALDAIQRVFAKQHDATVLHGRPAARQEPAVGARLVAVCASPGIAAGPVFQMRRARYPIPDRSEGAAVEGRLLERAIGAALAQFAALEGVARQRAGDETAQIIAAQAELLRDPTLTRAAFDAIGRGHGAAWAWDRTVAAIAAALRQNQHQSSVAHDLETSALHVLRQLDASADTPAALPHEPSILVADDLSPTTIVSLDQRLTLGLITGGGSPTGHVAILARALGIPAVVAAGPGALRLNDGTVVILDATNGQIALNPSPQMIASAQQSQELRQAASAREAADQRPLVGRDGMAIRVAAAVSHMYEVRQALASGADGIGLLRTEGLFLDRNDLPDEDEQYALYRAIVSCAEGKPVTIRTLDAGGEKPIPLLHILFEPNPALGVRGIRLSLARPDIFAAQVRAIYRASDDGPLRLLLPMVTTIEELVAARAIVADVAAALNAPWVPLGIMVEVPSAALLADELAPLVDFFAIGTNDLTQYTLARDRTNALVSDAGTVLHQAVRRLIALVLAAGAAHGRPVSICGEAASDPETAADLIDLGARELTVAPSAIGGVRAAIRARQL